MRIHPLNVALVAAAVAACGRSDRTTTDSAGGTVATRMAAAADTANPASVTPTEGAAQVTPTDARAVAKATKYKLTDDNFRRFVQASDSLAVLRARDPQARAWLDKQINDAGAGTSVSSSDAGRKHLEDYPAVSNAINAAGISVPDYFVASIAIAQAERFMGNPKAAPPTPTLSENAAFLNAHKAELQALRSREAAAH
jgi:hypothetical protein